ncbi:MAG TPA: 2,3-bisphosphoglycerate-independent phosphoglycerate mutase [Nitrospirota bacterium]
MKTAFRPAALIILDGWGVADDPSHSALARARTPYYDSLTDRYPSTVLSASGRDVGLPDGQMGNSEVGHLNIGAGRIVYQDYTRIDIAVKEGGLRENPVIMSAMDAVKATGGRLHLLGLLSGGGVHSDISHLFALIDMAVDKGAGKVLVHAFLDGRDTPPRSGLGYMEQLEGRISGCGNRDRVKVATVSGRYYAMDRDNRWERVKEAFDALVSGKGRAAASGSAAVQAGYDAGENDEFVRPTVIMEEGAPAGTISDGDGVIFFNFRTDRAREITRAIALEDFDGFDRPARPRLASYVCMTEYDETFGLPVAFPPVRLTNILGQVISAAGLTQLRIAETEKYAHVTFFFNGGEETPFPGEDRVLVPSPRDVATYDLKPEMSAHEVTDEALKRVGGYDFIILNFANPDMVGHTGVMEAAVRACEVVDGCLARIVPAVIDAGGIVIITADHGNVEKMVDEGTGSVHTAHTSNLVPFIVCDGRFRLDGPGRLADAAPTMLDIMGMDAPPEMTGRSLLVKDDTRG